VREWFGDRLKATNEAAWKAAHSRLYDHLRATTREGNSPKLADLAPLYHAVAHGCRAGRQQKALDEVYVDRICRWRSDGQLEFYSSMKLGAGGSNLAAVSWFFDRPYETPAVALTPPARAFVLGEASFALRAQGRLQEALPAMRTTLCMLEGAQNWRDAALTATNLTETELLVGQIDAATATAEKAVKLADRAGDAFAMMVSRSAQADALHTAGEWEKAADLFADAERRQREWHPHEPLLYSLQGYLHRDLLLSQGRAAEARDRADKALEIRREAKWLQDIALDTLTLGRAHLALALEILASGAPAESATAMRASPPPNWMRPLKACARRV
jgi:tetratricopeptide (TPR) repeat protein